VVGLPAVPSVFLDRPMQIVFGMLNSPLAPVDIFGVKPRHAGK
jgi:hypothetical protein